MKTIATFILLIVSLSTLARGGGDTGGGPTLEFKLNKEASKIEFGDMYLTTSDSRLNNVKKVKVVVKYKIPERVCRDSRNGKTRCINRAMTHYKRVVFDKEYFPNETIERLKSRKLFSSKDKYIELAKDNVLLDVFEKDNKQVVTVEVY